MNRPIGKLLAPDIGWQLNAPLSILLELFIINLKLFEFIFFLLLINVEVRNVKHHLRFCVVTLIFLIFHIINFQKFSVVFNEFVDVYCVFICRIS